MNDYAEYARSGHNHQNNLLEISSLAQEQVEAEKQVEKLEAALKNAKEVLREISEKKIPEEMDRLGISTYSTPTGISVKVEEKIRASLAVENRQKGFVWLEENGYGGMIKSSVVVAFKRDELEYAEKLVEALREDEYLVNLERKVEPMTLTAFIKEQLAQGKDIPLDIFGVFRQRVAKVEV